MGVFVKSGVIRSCCFQPLAKNIKGHYVAELVETKSNTEVVHKCSMEQLSPKVEVGIHCGVAGHEYFVGGIKHILVKVFIVLLDKKCISRFHNEVEELLARHENSPIFAICEE